MAGQGVVIEKILVANRGEIACRVMRTVRRLGVATVAVYSDADARARHVAEADEAYRIGPPPASESYLDGRAVIEAARRGGADAIHPGYGFLAENADFAEACAEAGVVFIGPPPAAIRAMGEKHTAKALMTAAGLPVVPGIDLADATDAAAEELAGDVGFPLVIKPSAGGGGKGMRVVTAAADFAEALAASRREARAAFGDDRILVEHYLEESRHIEVQIFADLHGNAVHLFERDCSLQRRQQKVIEEAPAPRVDAALRDRLGEAAVRAARAAGYVGAGTVEFLVDSAGGFFFMEMNTRLQVEHPVTEMVTGLDLVAWQIGVARGDPLPARQGDLSIDGHAIEARIYAEDPARGFLPAAGRLSHLRLPPEDEHLRIDSGVEAGDTVSVHYDPMIAKVIVWDHDRAAAARRLRLALGQCEIGGVANNLSFTAALLAHPAFEEGAMDVGFVDRRADELIASEGRVPDRVLGLAVLAVLATRAEGARIRSRRTGDPHSPWHTSNGWRLNHEMAQKFRFRVAGTRQGIAVRYREDGLVLELPGGTVPARCDGIAGEVLNAEIDGRHYAVKVIVEGERTTLFVGGGTHRLVLEDRFAQTQARTKSAGRLLAPIPGRIGVVTATAGKRVRRGTPLMIIEAMKMEHAISAPADGEIARVNYAVGDLVEEGAELVAFTADEEA